MKIIDLIFYRLKNIIYIAIFVLFHTAQAQSLDYIPGGIDFASRILGNYSLPVRTLGFEGAMRNPADYGSGLNINRVFYESSVYNYFGLFSFERDKKEETFFGTGIESIFKDTIADFSGGLRMAFGLFLDHGIESVQLNDDNPQSENIIFGWAYLFNLADWGKLNLGILKYAPLKGMGLDFLVSRIDYGIDIDIIEHLTVNLIYRNVTSYSVNSNFPEQVIFKFPNEILSSSYAIYHRINGFQFSFLGKIWTNPHDITDYYPCLHLGYTLNLFEDRKIPFSTEGIAELFIGTEGRYTIGINVLGFTLQVGHNKFGTSYNLFWAPAFLIGE